MDNSENNLEKFMPPLPISQDIDEEIPEERKVNAQDGIQQGLNLVKDVVSPGDMSDLFEVPEETDNDIQTDDLVDLYEEDVFGGDPDMSDLTSVKTSDIMGTPPKSRRKRKVVMRRTSKPYYPQSGMQGMR